MINNTVKTLKRTAELLKVDPVMNIAEVTARVNASHASPKDHYALLDNGDLLFCDLTPQGLKRAQKKKSELDIEGIESRLRPTSYDVLSIIIDNPHAEADTSAKVVRIDEHELTNTQKLFRQLLVYAHTYNTSDVHIETNIDANTARLRIRVDGELTTIDSKQFEWTAEACTSVASTLVTYEAKSKWDQNRPIDVSCEVKINSDVTIPIRYSHAPIKPTGLSIALRLFEDSSSQSITSFEELGYSEFEQGLLKIIFRYPFGLVLFTGPTGSGKSTAMQAGISRIPDTKKVITFEDPVEKHIPGACQVEINKEDAATDLPNYARTVLRQNPNVIVYGESRDISVLNAASEQADTGHLVLTTLHTNGAPEAVDRMHAMGMPWADIAKHDHLRAIIAQRLVPRLCNHCKIPLQKAIHEPWATEDHHRVWQYFNDLNDSEYHIEKIQTQNHSHGKSCEYCEGRGHLGRRPIIEIVTLSNKDREYIAKGDVSGWIEHMKEHGWERMTDKAIRFIFNGEICPLSTESYVSTPFGVDADVTDYRKLSTQINETHKNRLKMAALRSGVSESTLISHGRQQ